MEQQISINEPALKRNVTLSPRSWHHPIKKNGLDGGGGMKLIAAELAYVRAHALCITEKCHGCGKLMNQPFRYTIAGNPEAYCSAACRDLVFFGDRREARKHSTPGKCVYCGATLDGKRRGGTLL